MQSETGTRILAAGIGATTALLFSGAASVLGSTQQDGALGTFVVDNGTGSARIELLSKGNEAQLKIYDSEGRLSIRLGLVQEKVGLGSLRSIPTLEFYTPEGDRDLSLTVRGPVPHDHRRASLILGGENHEGLELLTKDGKGRIKWGDGADGFGQTAIVLDGDEARVRFSSPGAEDRIVKF